jgi:hypothetical protein
MYRSDELLGDEKCSHSATFRDAPRNSHIVGSQSAFETRTLGFRSSQKRPEVVKAQTITAIKRAIATFAWILRVENCDSFSV